MKRGKGLEWRGIGKGCLEEVVFSLGLEGSWRSQDGEVRRGESWARGD